MNLNRMFISILSVFLLLLSALGGSLAYAASFSAPPSSASVVMAPEDAAPPAVTKKNRYKKSRLTNDESEMTADKRRLLLSTGEDKSVDLDFEANAGANGISVGNPSVVTPTLVKINEKRQIVFKPLKAGETTVTVRDVDGTLRLIFSIRVTGNNLLRIAGELRELLKDIEGINIRIVGQKIVIDGDVIVPADYGRVVSVVADKSYTEHVMSLVGLSPLALSMLSKKIQEDISAFAPNVKSRVVNGMIWLEGTVDNSSFASRAFEVAKLYLPDVRPSNPIVAKDPGAQVLQRFSVYNFITINPPQSTGKRQDKLVRVTFNFVELSKDYNKLFGFKWQPGFTSDPTISVGTGSTGSTTTASSTASFSATLSSLFPKLMSAQASGFARILKTGTVITRSGQKAEIEESTNFPYMTTNEKGQVANGGTGVGISVSVVPQVLGQTADILMNMKLKQISLVGRAPASGGVPVTSVHTVDTSIYVHDTESAALAGVSSSDVGTDFNKDDPKSGSYEGGTTDALFSLLRSKAYRKKKSQFVIFVTPQIIENASDGTDDLKKNFRVKAR